MSTPRTDEPTRAYPPPPPRPVQPAGNEQFDRDRISRRVVILALIAAALIAILILRLWSLQVLDVQTYRAQASSNGLRSIDVPAARGQILDNTGKVLVGSRPSNSVAIDPTRFPELLLACGRDVQGPGDGRSSDQRALAIAEAIKRAERLPAARRAARLQAIQLQLDGGKTVRAWAGCSKDYPQLRELAGVAGVTVAEMEDDIHRASIKAPFDSIVIAKDVDRDVLFYLKERAGQFPGVRIVEGTARSYRATRGENGKLYPMAPHLWGELGEVSADQVTDQVTYRNASAGDIVGQRGVEQHFDRYLRGANGSLQRRVDAFGDPVGSIVRSRAAKPGDNVRLTIDAGIQTAAENALREAISYARTHGHPTVEGGAIVAMDPRTGAIRAMASNPGFDPAILASSEGDRYWGQLAQDAKNSPLLNRALNGLYPAGSTFKPVTAIAAGAAGLVRPDSQIQCSPQMEIDGQVYRNFESGVNEPMNALQALMVSCDTYFYELGKRLYDATPKSGDLEPQPLWARRLGFGAPTGIDIGGDSAGSVPDYAYKRQRFGDDRVHNRWTSGDAVLQSIGQGDLEVTPLQIARLYALLANGGTLVEPHVGASVYGQDGTLREKLEAPPGTRVQLDPYMLATIRKGLEGVTADKNGTAYGAFLGFPVAVAGKTGTAEKLGKRDFAWFAGYAPANNPTLVVVCVIEQGGFGGVAAAPAVRQVFAKALGVDEATIGQIASAEAAGVYSGPALGTDPAQELDGNSGPLFPSTTAETTG
jgi:penicillin-binding protein 2